MPAQPVRGDEPDVTVADVQTVRHGSDDWWPLDDDDPDAPVKSFFHYDGLSETFTIKYVQDCTDLIEWNKAAQNHNDGYSPTRNIRRACSIPLGLQRKWLAEEGWDCMDPQNWPKLKRRLNDPDFRHLRTAPGRL